MSKKEARRSKGTKQFVTDQDREAHRSPRTEDSAEVERQNKRRRSKRTREIVEDERQRSTPDRKELDNLWRMRNQTSTPLERDQRNCGGYAKRTKKRAARKGPKYLRWISDKKTCCSTGTREFVDERQNTRRCSNGTGEFAADELQRSTSTLERD